MTTRFCAAVGVDYPIVAFSHCRDVVAAVSRAGGLGVFGAAKFTPEQLEVELSWIDEHVGGRPYGVDVLAPSPSAVDDPELDLSALAEQIPEQQRRFVDDLAERFDVPPAKEGASTFAFAGIVVSRRTIEAHVEIALSHRVKFLVSALGPFRKEIVDRAHAQGTLIGGMCGSVAHAIRHASAGADVIIAQGHEAGGHTGEISTLVLTPQVVDAVAPIPVLAAGGVGTGRQLAAVLALGAQGAWMGSAWLTTEESDVDELVIEKLLQADSSQTIRTKSLTGKPVRTLRTPLEDAWSQPNAPPTLPAPQQGLLMRPLIQRAFQNNIEPLMGSAVGQVVGLMKERRACRALVNEIMTELVETLDRVGTELSE